MQWIEQVLKSPGLNIMAFPAALLLGFLTAVTSCCNIGIVAAIAGFAGSRGEAFRRRDAIFASIFFMLGTVLSLSALGLLVGHFSGLAGTSLRRYSIAILGFAAIISGLAALKLLPFRLPTIGLSKMRLPRGYFGSAAFGLAVGAASIACTACCGPLLPIVLGMAAMRGQAIWGALILGLFAIGYSIPLAALMLGVGFGRTTILAQKALKPIRLIAGVGLIGAGFWLIATM